MPEGSSDVERMIFWGEGWLEWLWKRRKSYSCSRSWSLPGESADGLGCDVSVVLVLDVSDSESESESAPDPRSISIATSLGSSPASLFLFLLVLFSCSSPVSAFPSFLSFAVAVSSNCCRTGASNSTGPRRAANFACRRACRASSSLRDVFELSFSVGEEGDDERERLRSARRIRFASGRSNIFARSSSPIIAYD